jgi:hypothetical protein
VMRDLRPGTTDIGTAPLAADIVKLPRASLRAWLPP